MKNRLWKLAFSKPISSQGDAKGGKLRTTPPLIAHPGVGNGAIAPLSIAPLHRHNRLQGSLASALAFAFGHLSTLTRLILHPGVS
ncbi:hypothetical protein [Nostoc sp. LEGE 12450]|uniref:hypothetical protein n=1 Tax=Nostoc sp. LEGE 12450 TaxID=1828643 RepID=UPI001880E6D8|nr:hypothetical protein [Nostoc sp. LEGE 12450]MBE8988073.1 hypothetical protein [Nostoc sp. LEGE 12450]